MSEAKHTPGEWDAGELDDGTAYVWAYQHAGDDQGLLIGQATAEHVGPEQAEANARLWAAAPELLAALESLVNLQKGREHWPEVRQAEAAIAKALGAP